MKNAHLAFGIVLIAILFVLTIQNVNAQTVPTLSNDTVTAILNGFNPMIGSITTSSYALASGCPIPSSDNSSNSINKIQCGLVASDPLNNETMTQDQLQATPGYWFYYGDAPLLNAPYAFYRDSQGLHIGVQSPGNGTYAGFYAETPNTNAQLFHAVLTAPSYTIPNEYFQNGLYVQTSQPPINYVACVSITNSLGTIWVAGHVYGDTDQALVFQTLWVDNSVNQPLTRDCTIITNGQNYLKVYIDNNLVYSSNTLALGMPAPFNAYLEPQTSNSDQELFGTYNDFYVSSNEFAKVINNPSSAATAEVIDSSGNVLVSSPVILGNATIDIGKYHLPLSANIKVFDSNNVQLASTPLVETVYGGDVYSVTNGSSIIPTVPTLPNDTIPTVPPIGSTSHLTVSIQSDNGSALTGYLIQLKQNGITVERGYSPKAFTLINNQQYVVHPEDYGHYSFDHWLDTNSVIRDRVISISSDTSIIAIYKFS